MPEKKSLRMFVISDNLQPLGITQRVLEKDLGDVADIQVVEWNTDGLGGMAAAALMAETGGSCPIPQEWAESYEAADILVTHYFPLQADAIDAAKAAKIIASFRHGLENVDVEAATRGSKTVINNPGRTSDPVSDITICAIIDQVRCYARADREVRSGLWRDPLEIAPQAMDMRYVTVGVLGFGTVGRLVTSKLRPFGCRLLVHDPHVSSSDIVAAGAEPVELDELLAQSHVVSLHVRLCDETFGLIGEREFGLMRQGAILVNTARAQLVNEDAMRRAFERGVLSGAALDVYWHEPLSPDHWLLSYPTVTVVPHIAGSTINSEETSAVRLAARIRATLDAARVA